MKTHLKKFFSCLAVLSLPLAASANDTEYAGADYDLPTYTVADLQSLPQLLDMPTPRATPGMVGKTLYMQLTISETGEPSMVRSKVPLFGLGTVYPGERDFAVQMKNHLRDASFTPAMDTNGQPVAVSVILPIKVVERLDQTAVEVSMLVDSFKGA